MSDLPDTEQTSSIDQDIAQTRKHGRKLLKKLLIYHAALAVAMLLIALMFPSFLKELPIGGVSVLEESGDVTVNSNSKAREDNSGAAARSGEDGNDMVDSLINATSRLDSLGYARKLVIVLVGIWLLMLPVSWVHRGMHHGGEHDHSLDETTLILPGVVASIVLVVQHSLALAFSLAGIIAGVQFRRALQDTYDALFILAAIGIGIAAGVEALEIAAVLSVFFVYATLYVTFYGDGLETHYALRKKLEKKKRKSSAAEKTKEEQGTS